jgi:aerobic C4-dicarboxylate transport protein
VDRFMSEARAITNTIGNAVGTVVVARWVGAVDRARMARVLDGEAFDQEAVPQQANEVRDDAVVGLAKPQNVSV